MEKTTIHGYELTKELTTKNAGFCQWGFCRKDGREYFIKQFLDPKYPEDTKELSKEKLDRKRKICDDFYVAKQEFYHAIETARTGNNVIILEFFREGSRYYIVTDRVKEAETNPKVIADSSSENKIIFIRSLLYSIKALHDAGVVHADLKPDNILLKRTKIGSYTAKIIDFDAGFLEGQIPEDIHGDFQYLAPETFLKMDGENVSVDRKADVFALGLLLHQYWTGELPKIEGESHYIFEAILNDEPILIRDDIPQILREQIRVMVSKDPVERPEAGAVLNALPKQNDMQMKRHDDHPESAKTKSGLIMSSNLKKRTRD